MQKVLDKYDAFLSYARVDDETVTGSMGDVSKFHAALEREMRGLWNRHCRIFIDRDIQSGERWRQILEERLNEVNFMIAMLSPSFFGSSECRGEIELFSEKAEKEGVEPRIFPIVIQEVAYVEHDEFYLEMMARNFANFTKIKYKSPDSEEFREFIAKVASDIFDKLRLPNVPTQMSIKDMRELIKQLQGENSNLLISVEEISQSLSSANDEIATIRGAVENLNAEKRLLSEQDAHFKSENAVLLGSLDASLIRERDLTERLTIADADRKKLNRERESLNSSISTLTIKISELRQQVDELESKEAAIANSALERAVIVSSETVDIAPRHKTLETGSTANRNKLNLTIPVGADIQGSAISALAATVLLLVENFTFNLYIQHYNVRGMGLYGYLTFDTFGRHWLADFSVLFFESLALAIVLSICKSKTLMGATLGLLCGAIVLATHFIPGIRPVAEVTSDPVWIICVLTEWAIAGLVIGFVYNSLRPRLGKILPGSVHAVEM